MKYFTKISNLARAGKFLVQRMTIPTNPAALEPVREYGAFLNNKLIGKMFMDPRNKRVMTSEIFPDYRRQGWGTKMYQDIIKQAGALDPDKQGLVSDGAKHIWQKLYTQYPNTGQGVRYPL